MLSTTLAKPQMTGKAREKSANFVLLGDCSSCRSVIGENHIVMCNRISSIAHVPQ